MYKHKIMNPIFRIKEISIRYDAGKTSTHIRKVCLTGMNEMQKDARGTTMASMFIREQLPVC